MDNLWDILWRLTSSTKKTAWVLRAHARVCTCVCVCVCARARMYVRVHETSVETADGWSVVRSWPCIGSTSPHTHNTPSQTHTRPADMCTTSSPGTGGRRGCGPGMGQQHNAGGWGIAGYHKECCLGIVPWLPCSPGCLDNGLEPLFRTEPRLEPDPPPRLATSLLFSGHVAN